MTRAIITQLVEALEVGWSPRFTEKNARALSDAAILAAREYLATEPKPTLKEALAQQGIKLRTEFEPKQRDHIEDSLGMVGERAELIARLAKQWAELDPVDPYRADVGQAVDILEADAQQAKRVPLTFDEVEVIYHRTPSRLSFARAIEAHHGIGEPADKPTGWDNGLSQDYCAEFGQWLASRPGARQQIKEMFDEPEDLYLHPPQPQATTPAVLKRLSDEAKRGLVGAWFSEDWAQKAAYGMLDDFETAQGEKP